MARLKIRPKLALVVAVPLVAVLSFAALAVVTTGGEAMQSERLRTLVAGNAAAGDLVYELQAERSIAVRALTGKADDEVKTEYDDQIAATDKSIDDYQAVRGELTDAPSSTGAILDRIDVELERLESVRERVGMREKAASAAAFAYRITIAELLSYRESVPQAVGASDVGDQIRASTLLSRNNEYLSIENAAVLRALDQGELTYASQREITAANTGSTDATLTFNSVASPQWRSWLEQSQTGKEMIEAQTLENEALRTPPGEELTVDKSQWVNSMKLRAEKLQEVQQRIDDQVVNEVIAIRDAQYRWTAAQVGGVLLAVIVALVLAMRLAGPVVRGLRRLRDSAHRVAKEDLPKAVAQLEDHQVLGEQTPEEFARQASPPVRIRGRDELADVGQAFNEVHQEAIRVAAHQALLRIHIGAMFVRLARRGHSLSGRLTAVLDEAERNEQDPDRLERLFALDHLVTLFGRTNDSLLVLGGVSPGKPRSSNETAANVLTAAQSQIELYQQVQIGAVDNVSVKAAVVDDVVKLLAELLDNATRYSGQQVSVTARLLADRMIVQIHDRGIGIPPDRIDKLNARLASHISLDLEALQTMGLTVVGQLAARHGIQVELRQAVAGGTLAEISLLTDLLEEKQDPLALPAGSGGRRGRGSRRGAPLFSRGRRRQGGGNDAAPPQEQPERQDVRQPARALRDGSRHQLMPEHDLPVANSGSHMGAGMPVIRLDWVTVRTESSVDNAHTMVQPAVEPAGAHSRTMNIGGQHRNGAAGWQAAQRARNVARETYRNDGLPRRDPMAQLVPGAVEPSGSQPRSARPLPRYRDPATAGATYAAYSRSRERNRPQSTTNDRSRKTT